MSPELAERDFYPAHLRDKIDSIGDWMTTDLNTGVYKAGFAPDQETYDKNVIPVFGALNKLEKIVSEHGGPYVLGSELTELDLRLYPTLIRFDVNYRAFCQVRWLEGRVLTAFRRLCIISISRRTWDPSDTTIRSSTTG